MFQIKNLPFDLLEPVERISLAAHGAVLSIQSDTFSGVGLRTRADYPDSANEALLVIGGTRHGTILSLNALKHPSAIDISKLVEFVANQPAVAPPYRAETGTLMRRKDKNVFAAVANVLYDGESFNTAYIALSSDGDIKLGSALPGMNSELWLRVAPSFDVAWKKEYRHLGPSR